MLNTTLENIENFIINVMDVLTFLGYVYKLARWMNCRINILWWLSILAVSEEFDNGILPPEGAVVKRLWSSNS